jgi:hypothetical protein
MVTFFALFRIKQILDWEAEGVEAVGRIDRGIAEERSLADRNRFP